MKRSDIQLSKSRTFFLTATDTVIEPITLGVGEETTKARKRTKKDSRKSSDLQERITKRPAKVRRVLNSVLSVKAPKWKENGAVRGAMGAFIDITQHEQMEETLRESEDKYRTLVEQSLQGTFVIQDMHIVFCNRTFAKMGGYTLEEIYSFSPEEVRNLIHPDDQERIWGRFRGKLAGEPLPPIHNDLRAFRKDGSIAWVEYDAVRINYAGRPAVQVSLVDITMRKQAEGERERLIRSLQDALAKIRRLHGLLPICASCKRIRNDKGYWEQLEAYIEEHSEAEFSHGFCPDCMKKLYGFSLDEDGKVKEK